MSDEIKSLKIAALSNLSVALLLLIFDVIWLNDYVHGLINTYYQSIKNELGIFVASFLFFMVSLPAPTLIMYLSLRAIYFDYLLRKKLKKSFWQMRIRDYF